MHLGHGQEAGAGQEEQRHGKADDQDGQAQAQGEPRHRVGEGEDARGQGEQQVEQGGVGAARA